MEAFPITSKRFSLSFVLKPGDSATNTFSSMSTCREAVFTSSWRTPQSICGDRGHHPLTLQSADWSENAAAVLSRYLVPALCNQARLVRLIGLYLKNPVAANDLLA